MEPAVYEKLGSRTFWVFVFESSSPAIVLFIVAFILLIVEGDGAGNVLPFLNTYPNLLTLVNSTLVIGLTGILGLFLLFIAIAFITATLKYWNYHFYMDENALRIRYGILSRFETSIPYRQIQDVDIKQTMTQRMMGVARIAILTAGHNDAERKEDGQDFSEGALPVLEKNRAEKIRDILLQRANIEQVVSVTPIPLSGSPA